MTTDFLPLTDTREFQRLFVAQENASHALTCATAANPKLEFDDPATWQPLETAMSAAYADLVNFINAHTRPAGPPRSVPEVEGIRANSRYDAAQVAYMEAGAELDKVAHIGPHEPEYFLYEAADASCAATRHALEAAIDAHCATQVYKALLAVTPIPPEKAEADAPYMPEAA